MKKEFLLSVATLALCLAPSAARADEETGTLMYYPIPREELNNNYYDWKKFVEYNVYREPCQGYEKPPHPYLLDTCKIRRFQREAAVVTPPPAIEPAAGTPQAPMISTIYFDFDQSNLRDSEQTKFDTMINQIKTSNPSTVTVAGHADRAGPETYNESLSERRAETVTNEMISRGISRDIIEQKAYGETMPQVQTADGVPLQENRRAIIEYDR